MKSEIYHSYSSSFGKNEKLRLDEIKKREPYIKHLIKKYFLKDLDSSVLDIACGYGALSLIANNFGYKNVIGIDISKEEIEIGKNIGIKNLVHGDIFEYFRTTKKKFDLIICQDFIEHLTREQINDLLVQISLNLSANGHVLIHTINGDSPFFGKVLNGDITHERAFNRNSINQILNLHNFKIIDVCEEKIVIHSIKSIIRNILWKFIRFIYKSINLVETGSSSGIYTQNFLIYAKKI